MPMFFVSLLKVITFAQSILPMIAQAHLSQTPDASNAALIHTDQILSAVKDLVALGEAESEKVVAAGGQPLLGEQKLAIAQDSVRKAHQVLIADVPGTTTETFDKFWNPINNIITAYCASQKKITDDSVFGSGQGG